MKPLLVVAASLLSVVTAPGQQRESLDGTWSLRRDVDGRAADPAVPVQVPAAFETALGTDFDGIAWYEREFAVPADHRGQVRIEFAAVATHATVFCNGVEVGSHLGGWTPFRVDVTTALRTPGPNKLEVRVDEKVGHNTQGFLPIVQPHFGGIWQGVTLCLDRGPVIDRLGLTLFGDGQRELRCTVPTLGVGPGQLTLAIEVFTPAREPRSQRRLLASTQLAVGVGRAGGTALPVPGAQLWSPGAAHLYTVRIRLLQGDTELDEVTRKVGFRALAAEGTKVLWNGSPLQLRGILHWGYSPPYLAPPVDPEFWRRQLRDFKSLGFNCVKCCLWVPPRSFYELCDEFGLLVWQEYPTWHPKMDQVHKDELLAEYGEFFVHDRSHASVAFRSITCETGHGADLDVVKALYEACKAAVPDTLVVDDSSWIGWQRITDFWDEHPYGNNSWFPGRLAEFQKHIAEKGEKPLLLGECIAADTWLDLAAWRQRHGDARPWWQPTCLDAQAAAEAWLTAEFGPTLVPTLLPISLDFGLANRKFQIEQLRLQIPEAGYVVSVARDIPKCRMGLYDEHDQLKWSRAQWAWHRDTMLCLDLPFDGRALSPQPTTVPVRISHFGTGPLQGRLRLWSDRSPSDEVQVDVALQPGELSAPVLLPLAGHDGALERVRVRAELLGSHPAQNHWDLWRVPAWHYRQLDGIREVDRLTPEVLTELENGARVLLHAGDRKGSLRTEYLWFLRGAPFAPEHPFHRRIPRDLLLELSSFDLETGRVMPWQLLRGEVDPILAFWETHDIPEVRQHLLAFDCRVGKGRLLATTLRLDPAAPLHSLGHHVRYNLIEHLQEGPPPRRELSAATIAALRASLTEKKIELPVWRFRTDPKDEGRTGGWQLPAHDVSTAQWRDLKAGSHWENQAEDLKHYTGVAWYRIDVDVPADWQDLDARAVFDGVDDSFELWLDGEPAGTFGDPATKTTIWLERQVAELGRRLRPGARNTLVLRVVDHAGAGGLWKPVFLTTGPADARSQLLH